MTHDTTNMSTGCSVGIATRNSPGRTNSMSDKESTRRAVKKVLERAAVERDFTVAVMVIERSADLDMSIIRHLFTFCVSMVSCALPTTMSVYSFAVLNDHNDGKALHEVSLAICFFFYLPSLILIFFLPIAQRGVGLP